jgi:hypothetical protein
MLRVLVKVATFVNGAVHKAGEEIVIAEHLFSEEVHTLLETLGIEKEAPPVAPLPSPAPETAPAAVSTSEPEEHPP